VIWSVTVLPATELDSRGRRLRTALAAVLVPDNAPELQLLRGVGRVLRQPVEGFTLSHGPPAGGIKIVVVEDDDDNREVLADHLTAESATVVAVSTAAEALPLVPSADIIVTDYALPGEDAVWLLERVNKQPSPIPVIVVSGYDERQKPRLAAAPFAGKLLKPLDFGQVCAEIAVVLGHRR
jgi:CheY-like chemotaxis protein